MRVVIDNATLRKHRSCKAVYSNPEWRADLQALVLEDFDKSVERYLSTPKGVEHLAWHVRHKLVPMTEEQFEAAKKAHGVSK